MKKFLFILFFATSYIIGLVIFNFNENKKEQQLLNTSKFYENALQSIIEQKRQLSDIIISGMVQKAAIASRLYELSIEDDPVNQEMYRELIFRDLNPRFSKLQENGIRGIHIHLSDGASFLRMHHKQKFGDDLLFARPSVAYVNKYHHPLSTIEVGKYITGLRFVYPISHLNRHLGSIEISFKMDSVTKEIMNTYDVLSNFFVKKEIVESKMKENTFESYKPSHFEDYFNDTSVLQAIKEYANLNLNKQKPNRHISEQIHTMGQLSTPNSLYDENLDLIFTVLPILNSLTKQNIGFITIRSNPNELIVSTLLIEVIIAMSVALIALMFYTLYQTIMKKEQLQEETKIKTKALNELNHHLQNEILSKIKEQDDLLLLFERGDSVLFRFNNDKHWSVDYVSSNVSKLLGYAKDSFMNSQISYLDCIFAEDLPRFRSATQEAIDEKQDFLKHQPYKIFTKDNQTKWVLNYIVLLKDSHGNVVQFLGYLIDITQYKEKELKIQKTQERFITVFEKSLDSILILDLETKKFIDANERACVMYGYTKEEFCTFGPEKIDIYDDEIQVAKRQKKIAQKGWDIFDTKHETKDKKILDITVNVVVVTLDDKPHLYVTFKDITAQKQQEKLLEQNLLKLKLATEVGNIGIWIWDLKSNTLEWDEQMYKIYDEQKIEGQNNFVLWTDALHEQDKEEAIQRAQNAASNGEVFDSQFRIITQTQEIKYIKALASPLYNSKNEVVAMVGINIDITEEKLHQHNLQIAKEKAEIANQIKSEFLANMSHEIRTPLNGIIGMTDIVLDTHLTSAQQEYLQKSKTSALALLQIINDILDYSKIEAKKLDLHCVDFNIFDMLTNVSSLFLYKIEQKGLTFHQEIDENIPRSLFGDSLRISQVLTNLLGNSVKFTKEGFIKLKIIQTKQEDTKVHLRFEVSDSGIGVSKEKQDTLFGAFVQEDSSITKQFGGSGLGLAISKELIELMGGTLWFESEKNKGSSFFFEMTLQKSQNTLTKNTSVPLLDNFKVEQSLKALLVEDNEINQIVATKVLEKIGFKITVANNGLEAVNMAQKEHFNIIFMDLQMPIMDGFEASQKIREFDTQIPIIALSAAVMQKDKEQTANAGMNGHIAKPINIEHLQHIVAQYFKITSIEKKSRMDLVPNIEGVDMQSVQSELRLEPQEIYMMYDNFRRNYENFQTQIKELAFDSQEFHQWIHKLKGVSGNLKIEALFSLCKEIEQKDNKEILAKELFERLESLCDQIKTQISSQLTQNAPTLQSTEIQALLQALYTDAKAYNYIPQNKIDTVANFYRSLNKEDVAQEIETTFASRNTKKLSTLFERLLGKFNDF